VEQVVSVQESQVKPAARFSRNDLAYWAGLLFLFVGVGLVFGWGMACLVLGAVLTAVNIATSFFVTWLAVTVKEKK
jgi:hypothetical protein